MIRRKNNFILIKEIFALYTCTCEKKSFNRIKFSSFKYFEDNKLFILIKEQRLVGLSKELKDD